MRGPTSAGPVEAIGFATVALTLATVSLFALPAFADELADEMSLSSMEVGLLTSSLALFYVAVQVPAGVLGSVIGINRALALGLAVLGVGFAGSAVVGSFPALLVLRALTGLGAGMLLPLASALVAAVVKEGNARGQGILGSGWGLGYLFALLALPLVFDRWRPAFLTLGGLALAGAVYSLVRLPSARRFDAATALRETATGLATLAPWLLGTCLFGLTVANVGVGAWITVFVREEHGVAESGAAALVSLIGFGLLPASVAGALVARRIGARPVVVASCVWMVLAVVLIAAPLGLPALAFGLLLLGFCSGFPFGVILALGGATAPGEGKRSQGAVAGAINGIGFAAGVVTPPFVGFVRDESSFQVAFAVLVVGPLLALVAALAVLRR